MFQNSLLRCYIIQDALDYWEIENQPNSFSYPKKLYANWIKGWILFKNIKQFELYIAKEPFFNSLKA